MDKKSKNTLIVSIIALALVLVGVTYAYFSARITGLESASMIQLTAGRMGIVYSEGDGEVVLNNIYPKSEAWVTKVFTLTGTNTTNQEMKYEVGLNVTVNTFPSDYLTYDLRLISSDNGTPIATKTGQPINGTGLIKFGRGVFNQANNSVHAYELKIYFKDDGTDQNNAQQAIFNAKIDVTEYVPYRCYTDDTNSIKVYEDLLSYDINYNNCKDYVFEWDWSSEQKETFCTGGTVNDDVDIYSISSVVEDPDRSADYIDAGVIENVIYDTTSDLYYVYYTNGQYMYNYYKDSNEWFARLSDNQSTDPITSPLCYSIDDQPVTNLSYLFVNSHATSIDLSSFDTSSVTNMTGMFSQAQVTSVDLSSFDTSNVTSMDDMFRSSSITSFDLKNFNTSNVTSMRGMFLNVNATLINMSSFNTSNVTNMNGMFSYCEVPSLDFSNFDTSHVTEMGAMFSHSNIPSLDLSSFNTSRVRSMGWMFSDSQATDINVSSFDTSSVTLMASMFSGSNVTTLDLSSFDTSNVDNMSNMFSNSSNLETIYVSDSFTAGATLNYMFDGCTSLVGGAGTTYYYNRINGTYAHIDGGPSNPGYFTAK